MPETIFSPAAAQRTPVSLRDAFPVWLRIALLSFGGPAGQIAMMHRVLVEERRWIGDGRFLHALNYCMLLPGPEAQQLATYIGWLMHGVRGGLLAGTLFILPGGLAIMALSCIYALYGTVPLVAALFCGLKAAVLAIVLQAVVRIGGRTLGSNLLRAVAALAFLLIFCGVPFPLIIFAAGLAGFFGGRAGLLAFRPGGHRRASNEIADADTLLGEEPLQHGRDETFQAFRTGAVLAMFWLLPVALLVLLLGPQNVFSQIATFFSTMALVTFGGAYAVLAYVAQQAVDAYGWLSPAEMLDGLGMAETTPGPLILVLQFVGFMAAFRDPGSLPPLLAGTLGGLLAIWVTFAPCFLWIFLGAPFIERLRGNAALAGALSAIGAAVVGVILNLALWFAVHTLFRQVGVVSLGVIELDMPVPASLNFWAFALAAGAILAAFRLNAGPITLLAASSLAGLGLHLAGLI